MCRQKIGKTLVDFVEEEKLCVQIQKFRCLYDKASNGYKEKDRVSNAWRSVEEALELSEGILCRISTAALKFFAYVQGKVQRFYFFSR